MTDHSDGFDGHVSLTRREESREEAPEIQMSGWVKRGEKVWPREGAWSEVFHGAYYPSNFNFFFPRASKAYLLSVIV